MMVLDKAIASKKEHRKPYKGGKAIDSSCRNHGSCGHCKGDRIYNTKKQIEKAEVQDE
jgi:predicted metal-binding protein